MTSSTVEKGPLTGLRVIEFSAMGPVPHCAMLFSDLGADVLKIDRPGGYGGVNAVGDRGRATITLDIKTDEGREKALQLCDLADIILEGNRPGVMERLGLGPDVMCTRNPRLIYGRMTGWGQSGPLSQAAGHDINYIAITGALKAVGYGDSPSIPPQNFVGDYGGGSMYLALGVLSAIFERQSSGAGQVVDAAIVDGTASLIGAIAAATVTGEMSFERDKSELGGASPFYRCYVCADGKEISVGALEAKFYKQLLDLINAPQSFYQDQNESANWVERGEQLTQIFKTKTRNEWCALLEGTDACFAPVLSYEESFSHPHIVARGVYQDVDGVKQAVPAPRFSRTPGKIQPSHSSDRMIANWKAAASAK